MRLIILLGFFSILTSAFSQEKCATMSLPSNINRSETIEDFEVWLTQKKFQKAASRLLAPGLAQATVYEVPVVFHIVHDGSLLGSGSNISDAKILEQLEILNQDFRRTNEDASETASQFRSVAADTEIQFVMARQDPEGLPTNGIVRTKGTKTTYRSSDYRTLMSESFWPHEHYLNIYVTDLHGPTLGWAQFPFSNLEGIASELSNYKSTDGVLIDYKWVGVNENTGSFSSYGRTATHEIGHYLGLRHIWGDGNCSYDDFCEDTPLADGSTSGCSTNKVTCGSKDMVQNYMDYSDDSCMNLFTNCQRERMRLVLEESPRRRTLLTSPGLSEPQMVANDLGVRSIVSPITSDCNSEVSPSVQVRNYGTNQIDRFNLTLFVNNSVIEQKEVVVPLLTAETSVVSFSSIILSQTNPSEVRFEITSVNNATSANPVNDSKSIVLAPFHPVEPPYFEEFSNNLNFFTTVETGNPSTWILERASDEDTENIAAKAPFFNQQANYGDQDMLQTATLDLSGLNSVQLSFEYAYSPRLQDNSNHFFLDGLIVAVSTDCGESFSRSDYFFERYGKSLGTVSATSDSYTPTGASDWKEEEINLTRYAGQSDVKIAFIGINGRGNNLYLDNISVTNGQLAANDAGIRTIDRAPVVTCNTTAIPVIEVRNYGFADIESFSLVMTANGEEKSFFFDELSIESGDSEEYLINISDYLQPGENSFDFYITGLNGTNDTQLQNNSFSFKTLVEDSEDQLPIKEDFEDSNWSTFSPNGQMVFDYLNLDGDVSLYTNNYNVIETSKSYLVSPTITTQGLTEAGFHFKYSYAERQGYNDNLKVLLSIDCGKNYDTELLSLNSAQMAVTTSSTEWTPSSEEDWKSAFIDLSPHVHHPELRIAFVFSNGNGNRLFIDDINILKTSDPFIPDLDALNETMMIYPNPAKGKFNVSFNYHQKNRINIKLVDMSGRVVYDEVFHNILNDKITFLAPNQSGFYILYIKGTNGIDQSRRVYVLK
ncbi:MAG: choice-of-anchor J domain-containing protein [Marinoscillum sp.]